MDPFIWGCEQKRRRFLRKIWERSFSEYMKTRSVFTVTKLGSHEPSIKKKYTKSIKKMVGGG